MKEKMQQRHSQLLQYEAQIEPIIPDQPILQLPEISSTPAMNDIVMGEKAVFSKRSQSTIANHYGRLMNSMSPKK